MKTKIIADSSCDFFEIPGVDFTSVPLTIATEEKAFLDDQTLDIPKMLQYLAGYQGRSYTTCPNIDAWCLAYEGGEEIYVVTLSGNISGTYGAAVTAARLYQEEHPEAKIHIFDTLSAGPEVRMLAMKLAQWVKEGLPFEEICVRGEAYMQQTRIFFSLRSFHNFAQNGRVNKTVAKLGSMLGIQIMATASETGTIEILEKCRGEKGSLKKFMENLRRVGYAGGNISLAHCENLRFAQLVADTIRKEYPTAAIEIYETRGLCSYYAESGGILLGLELRNS